MSNDAHDIAIARFVRQTGLATPEQVAAAMQEQARSAQGGSPVSLAQVLVQQGILTPAQRETVEKKAQAAKAGISELLHYKLIRKLGEGGMGAVYLADDTKQNRKVAVKVLPKKYADNVELLKRFRREADAAATLKHPNIVGAYEFGEDIGYHFYVMEYCDGEPLDAVLKREKSLPLRQALDVTLQVAQGLKFAHDMGFIHRDVKPANIFLTKEGAAKILDLGLTKNIEDAELSFKTVSGAVLGTPHYISPEQAQGEKNVDGRTDIYSLGATFYHFLTGQTPFDGTTVYEILSKQVSAQLPNPQDLREEIPEGAVHVLRRMMAKAPPDRYRDCGDLIGDLQQVISGKTPETQVLDPNLSAVALIRKKSPARRPGTLRRMAAARRRSNPLVWLGVAGAAHARVVFFVLNLGTPPAPPSEARTAPTPRPAPAPPVRPPASPSDLLAVVDLRKDVVAGEWKTDPTGLRSEGVYTRLLLPLDAPEEYDYTVEFTRHGGSDVVQILSKGGRPFVWHLGGWHNSVFGFSVFGDKNANDHPASARPPGGLANGRRTVSRVEVRRDRVTGYVDGARLVELKTDFSDARILEEWKTANPRGLGLGVYGHATFHRAEVVDRTGKAERPSPETFAASIAALRPAEQVRRVAARLKELNPGFDGNVSHRDENGTVIELKLASDAVTDLSPVRALSGLRRFSCIGEGPEPSRRKGALTDLSPLRGLRLVEFDGSHNRDLKDLEPLRGMPLERLYLGATGVADLSPLRGMALRDLSINWTPVADLGPLQGMPLATVDLWGSAVRDFGPLRGLPLRNLILEFKEPREIAFVKSIPTLERINRMTVAEFWKKHGDPANDPVVSEPLARGLVGWWKLDEGDGDRAADSSGHGHHGRLLNGPAWVRGIGGKALRFTGTDALVELPNSPVLDDLQDGSYTVAAWFKPEALPAANDPRDPEYGILLKPGFNAGLKYAPPGMCGMEHWLKGDANVGLYSPPGDSPAGRFYHLVGIVDKAAGTTQLYVDGALRGTRKWTAGTEPRAYGKATWRIGIMLPGATVSRWATKGIIDDARLYNRVLSPAEIATLVRSFVGERPWRSLIETQPTDWLSPDSARGWRLEKGVLERIPGVTEAGQTRREFSDGEFRIRFEVKSASYAAFSVRQGDSAQDTVIFQRPETDALEGKPHELIFVCRGKDVTAWLDGKPATLVRSNPKPQGRVQWLVRGDGTEQLRILGVDYRE